MIKKIFTAAVAALALVACAPEYETDKLPIVIEYPESEGAGYLLDDEGNATVHTYEYKITEEGVDIKAKVSYSDGDWCRGYFVLSNKAIQIALGNVAFLDLGVFYPVESDGKTASGNWNSGYLGQWLDANGNGNGINWSKGHVYWFYECSQTYEIGVKDAFAIGTNNANAVVGETITSKNIIKGVPFNVTITVVD